MSFDDFCYYFSEIEPWCDYMKDGEMNFLRLLEYEHEESSNQDELDLCPCLDHSLHVQGKNRIINVSNL